MKEEVKKVPIFRFKIPEEAASDRRPFFEQLFEILKDSGMEETVSDLGDAAEDLIGLAMPGEPRVTGRDKKAVAGFSGQEGLQERRILVTESDGTVIHVSFTEPDSTNQWKGVFLNDELFRQHAGRVIELFVELPVDIADRLLEESSGDENNLQKQHVSDSLIVQSNLSSSHLSVVKDHHINQGVHNLPTEAEELEVNKIFPDVERVMPEDFRVRRKELFDKVRQGARLLVVKHDKPIGMLIPANQAILPAEGLTAEQLEKLKEVEFLSLQELKTIITLVRGEATLMDLIKKSNKYDKI